MDRGWGDAKIGLHVDLCRRTTVQLRVGVDEGQVLALLLGKGFGHFLDELSLAWCLGAGGTTMNIRYIVELAPSERQKLEVAYWRWQAACA